MKIGDFDIAPGAMLAPMAGITNPPFRRLCKEMGAAMCVTELISCHAVVYLEAKKKNRGKRRGVKTLSLMEKYDDESPYIVQLYGRDPVIMAESAKIVEATGADIIDLNFGCPAKKVIKNGEGSGVALMLDPPLLGEIIESVVSAVKIPVTAKTRLGYAANNINAAKVAHVMESSGVKLITIHARTRDQGHSGPINLPALKDVVNAVSIPVVGNGGIKCKADADEMIKKTGCARVAVGQGAKGNPWIFDELKNNRLSTDLTERVATCRRHLDLYVDWIGEERSVLEMRKHACWYLKGFNGAAAFRKRLGEAVSIKVFNNLLDEVLSSKE